MQITRQADYALRAMLYLARLEPDTHVATNKIAEEMLIPKSFLAKIISQLSVHGLINTIRGAKGGVSLARNKDDVSMYMVVVAIDGPIHLNECTADPSTCPFGETCPIHQVWVETEQELVERLKNTSLNDLLRREGNLPA